MDENTNRHQEHENKNYTLRHYDKYATPSKPMHHAPLLPGQPHNESPTSVLDTPSSRPSKALLPRPPLPPPPPPQPTKSKQSNDSSFSKDGNSVVHVEILLVRNHKSNLPTVSKTTSIKFTLGTAEIEEREEEMRSMANDALIPRDRWDGSLFYRKWKPAAKEQHDESTEPHAISQEAQTENDKQQQKLSQNKTSKTTSDHICIEPPEDILTCWSDVFLKSLKQFYESGTVHVPDSTNGRDFLILLEYFGIVHAPNKVVYESYGAYMRMKLWSEYLSRRSDMAMYIIHRCMSRSKLQHAFVTTKDPMEGTAGTVHYVDGRICDIFDGGFQASIEDGNGEFVSSCSG